MTRQPSPSAREKILSAARQVFADKGYKGATVREIARIAGVAVGGLYPYFGNKEQLYVEALQEGARLYKEGIGELAYEEPEVAVRRYIENHLASTAARKQSASLQFKDYDLEFGKPPRTEFFACQKEFLAGVIRKGAERGIFRVADCEGAAVVILSMLKGAVFYDLAGILDLGTSGAMLCRSVLGFLKREETGGAPDTTHRT